MTTPAVEREREPEPAGSPGRSHVVAAAVLLIGLTAVAYAGVLDLGFIWDDDKRLLENPTIRSLEGLRQIWFDVAANKQYYPLVFTSFWIEHRLWSLEPTGYHVVNVLLHASSAVLLWRLLRFLGVPGAWAAAALFALHPVHVESVAWVSERKNVLSGLFYLASARVYLDYAFARDGPTPRSHLYWAFALLLFVLALLSKTVTYSLPAALLLVVWWKTRRVDRRDVLALLPFAAIGVGFGLLTVWLEKYEVGTVHLDFGHTLIDRFLIAGRAVWFYVGKLLWPDPLIFFYPRWEIDSTVAWQYLFPLAALALVAALWLARRRVGRGPLAAVLFFGGTLFPALGFFDVFPMRFAFVADHFQYLASLGPIAFAAGAAATAARRLRPIGEPVAVAVLIVILAGYAVQVRRQVPVYTSPESLWRDTIQKNPGAFLPHYNLGNLLRKRGDIEEARRQYVLAVEANPKFEMAHNNVASMLANAGRYDEAIEHYRLALEQLPDYLLAHYNLAAILLERGELDGAMHHFREAVRIAPDQMRAHYGLAATLTKAGRPEEAHLHYVEGNRLRREAEKRAAAAAAPSR